MSTWCAMRLLFSSGYRVGIGTSLLCTTTLRCVRRALAIIHTRYSLCDQTAHNLYLVFDLCTGGELFDRICAKGNYYEAYVTRILLYAPPSHSFLHSDAADLVRTVFKAVKWIHECGIVHRGTFMHDSLTHSIHPEPKPSHIPLSATPPKQP